MDRTTDDESELLPFFNAFDRWIADLQQESQCFIKTLGDGFLMVKEYPKGHRCHSTVELLRLCWKYARRMDQIINQKKAPRPAGFRIRVASGHVWKTSEVSWGTDYRGRHINLASRLLRIGKQHKFICHESVKELMNDKQIREAGFKFKKISVSDSVPDGVIAEELKTLWKFECQKN